MEKAFQSLPQHSDKRWDKFKSSCGKFWDFVKDGSEAQRHIDDATARLNDVLGLPKQLAEVQAAYKALAEQTPRLVPFGEWEFYRPTSALGVLMFQLLAPDSSDIILITGMFGMVRLVRNIQ